jgi:hypothetical protein
MKKNSSRLVEMRATAYERNAGVRNAAGRTVVQPSDYLAGWDWMWAIGRLITAYWTWMATW